MATNYAISDNGAIYIQQQEGCTLSAIWDNIGYSIGYGHFMGKQDQGSPPPLDDISQQLADTLFINDIEVIEKCINSANLVLTQDQFDALCDLGYNAGLSRLKVGLKYLQNNEIDQCKTWWADVATHDHNGNLLQHNADRRNYEISLMDFDNFPQQTASGFDKINTVYNINKAELAGFNPAWIAVAVIIGYILSLIAKIKL